MSHDPTDPLDPADAADPKASALDAPSIEPSDAPSPPEDDAFDETVIAAAISDADMELPPPIVATPSAAAVAPPTPPAPPKPPGPAVPPTPDDVPELDASPPPVGDDVQPTFNPPPPSDATPPPKKKKGKGLMIGCGVALVLLLLVGGVLAIGGIAIVGAVMGGGVYMASQFDGVADQIADQELARLQQDAQDAQAPLIATGEDGTDADANGSVGEEAPEDEQTEEELILQEALAMADEDEEADRASSSTPTTSSRDSSSGSSSGGTAASADTSSGNRGSTDSGTSGTNRGGDAVVAEPVKDVEPDKVTTTKPAANSGTVKVKGKGKVVLKSGSAKYNVPGSVPAGRYEIAVTFPGESKQVVVGKVKVRSGGTSTIACNAAMGLCVAR